MTGPPIVPEHDDTIYLVLDDHGSQGLAYTETDPTLADRESIIADLIEGQFNHPIRVVAFSVGRKWSDDVSREIAAEIQRRVDYVDLTDAVRRFVDRHSESEQVSSGR